MFYRNHDSLNFFVQNYKTCFTLSIEVVKTTKVLHHSNLIYRQFNLSIQECLHWWFRFILSLQSFFPAVLGKPYREDDISLHIIQMWTEVGDISTESLPHLKSLIVRLRLIYPWVHYATFLGWCGRFLFRYIFFWRHSLEEGKQTFHIAW